MKRIEWIDAMLNQVEQLVYEHKVEEALSIAESLLFDEPGYGNLHNVLGWMHVYYTGNSTLAELHLKCSISFDPTYPAPYLHMAALYQNLYRYSEALDILKKGLVQPTAHRAFFFERMAQIHELKGAYGEAVKLYKKALAATLGQEADRFAESIRRCRKKRLAMMFSF
jgi:tetratricopeptide (TPR) repeat protein